MNEFLGKTARDVVSGYKGIATTRTEFSNGNVQFGLTGNVGADNKIPAEYFDYHLLEVVPDSRSVPVIAPSAEALALPLDSTVRDKVSGYKGVATRRTIFINGCVYYTVAGPHDPKAKYAEMFLDFNRLEIVQAATPPARAARTGGPAFTVPARG
jgi:hypothetical protein